MTSNLHKFPSPDPWEQEPAPWHREENDALGMVEIPANRLWGAQTERSRLAFPVGIERFRFGRTVIRSFGILKKCAALANADLQEIPRANADLIVRAAQEVI